MNNFFIIVGRGGTFRPEDGNAVSDPTQGIYTTPAEVDALFAFLVKSNIKKMAIHFHGGLVPQKSGIAAAVKVSKAIRDGGSFPAAFIWKTGLIDSIRERILESQNTEFFDKLKRIVLKKVAAKLGGKLGSKGVDVLSEKELNDELGKDEPFENFTFDSGAKSVNVINTEMGEADLQTEVEADIEADIEELALQQREISKEENPYLSLDVVTQGNQPGAKGLISTAKLLTAVASVIVNVIKRYAKGNHHGFYATVVEEIYRKLYIGTIGQEIWGQMKRKAKKMWIADQPPLASEIEAHVGSYFLTRMNMHMEANKDFKLDLIGHSAGSIVICELLNVLQAYQHVKIRNIIFMAPACLSSLFHPSYTSGTPFTNFYLFTMKDSVERKDRLVPGLYPHSLLYFIAGLLEGKPGTPILGLERYFLRDNLLKQYFSTRQTMSITTGGSLNSSATKHGDFDDNPDTLASITSIIVK